MFSKSKKVSLALMLCFMLSSCADKQTREEAPPRSYYANSYLDAVAAVSFDGCHDGYNIYNYRWEMMNNYDTSLIVCHPKEGYWYIEELGELV